VCFLFVCSFFSLTSRQFHSNRTSVAKTFTGVVRRGQKQKEWVDEQRGANEKGS
jgi:hypothetical protein